jgi:peptide chain release factor 1
VIEIRWTKGQGPGGQHKNKVETCCVATHKPSGIQVTVDGRSRRQNEKQARKLLKRRVEEERLNQLAARRKAARDEKIRNTERVRTYDYSRGVVTDHRTGKKASIKDVMVKGQLERLR